MIDGYLFKYLLTKHLNINYYMRKSISLFLLANLLWSQQISVSDLNKISNNQLDQIREELQLQNKQPVLNEPEDTMNTIQIESQINETDLDNEYFGYNYFKQDINFFDNIPTPADYKLGPGDEVILSLWGETNQRNTYLIDKNGMVFFDNIGFVNISNKTIQDAEILLIEELSRIYSTLKDKNNPTNLMLELGKIKSINVYFTGQVHKPGINLIHPFSDIFSALVQAGGVDNAGSLREVTLIRDNKVIETIDFYSFFTSGLGVFQKNRIIDGDVIHIPTVKTRVELIGEINNPKFYELLDTDTLSNLIEYAGGLKSTSSNKAVIEYIAPLNSRLSDDFSKSGKLVNLTLSNNVTLTDGAKVRFLPIANNDYSVSVYGRVTLPGSYPAFSSVVSSKNQQLLKNASLKEILDLAGGFNDPIFRKTIDENIVILRLDENQFYSQEFLVNYSESETFSLEINDKIFVYENPKYYNGFSYSINGEVAKPGVYPLRDGLTISDAISIAGGISEIGSINSISVQKTLLRFNEEGDETSESEFVGNISLDFEISDGNIITILPKTNVIRVEGNVYNPGLVSVDKGKAISMSNAIELAGGYKPFSLKRNSYVIRANGEIEQANIFLGRAKRVFPGDSVIVPVDPDPQQFDITAFIADLSSTLANIAAILVIADNN